MKEVNVLGIDLAKSVFHLHGVDKQGRKVFSRQVSRARLAETVARIGPCVVAMEACGGAHYWGREFERLGHAVRLISPKFVKPFVKSQKNDRNDAEAICEAASRPSMRFVAVKTAQQQDLQCLVNRREQLISTRTRLINEARAYLYEFGKVIPVGRQKFNDQLKIILQDKNLSPQLRFILEELSQEVTALDEKLARYDRQVKLLCESHPVCARLHRMPGIGKVSAVALVALATDPGSFRNGRQFAAFLGLVPRQYSTGGKARLGGITKRGNPTLRSLLIHGARSILRHSSKREDRVSQWAADLASRRGYNKAVVALANKQARMVWVLMAKGVEYKLAA